MTCHLFAKHKDVVALLGPNLSNNLDLSLYDKALQAGGDGAEFFISARDKDDQWNLLIKALSIAPSYDRNIDDSESSAVQENSPRSYMQNKTESAVEQASNIILSELNKSKPKTIEFDPIRDYGYLVTNLMVRDVVGLKMSKRAHPQIINRLRGRKAKTLKALEIKQANELIFWIEVMFGQLFINPGNHNKTILYASKTISKRYRKIIRKSLENPIKDSLIDRMITARQDMLLSTARFEELVINIVMELVGSFQYLTGQGFAGVHQTIHTVFARQSDSREAPLKAFNALMHKHPREMLDEALRHNSPTGFIFRTASNDFKYNGIDIASGDLVCVLCDQAVKDTSVFVNPESFYSPQKAIQHRNDYLTFASPDISPSAMRPTDSHHPCFGQYWARTMLKAMLEGLEDLQARVKDNNID